MNGTYRHRSVRTCRRCRQSMMGMNRFCLKVLLITYIWNADFLRPALKNSIDCCPGLSSIYNGHERIIAKYPGRVFEHSKYNLAVPAVGCKNKENVRNRFSLFFHTFYVSIIQRILSVRVFLVDKSRWKV